MTDPEFTPEANYKYRVRRLALLDNAPNTWIATGTPNDFEYYANAAMQAIRDSLWYSDSIVMIEDVAMYPIMAYVNGRVAYTWRDSPEAGIYKCP